MSENFKAPDHLVDQLVDTDPNESAEWQQSFDAVLKNAGPVRARYLMLSLLQRANEKNIGVSGLRTTDYINTIPPALEPTSYKDALDAYVEICPPTPTPGRCARCTIIAAFHLINARILRSKAKI